MEHHQSNNMINGAATISSLLAQASDEEEAQDPLRVHEWRLKFATLPFSALQSDPLYGFFSNNGGANTMWRQLTPCPYGEANRQRCPFGAHCCFVAESCRLQQTRPQQKPRYAIEKSLYDEVRQLLATPDRTPPRWLGTVAFDRKTRASVPPTALDRINARVLQLPLKEYMRQYGIVPKLGLCRTKHYQPYGVVDSEEEDEKRLCGEKNGVAHAPAELVAQFNCRALLDYYRYRVLDSRQQSQQQLVPQKKVFIACLQCDCRYLLLLSIAVRLYQDSSSSDDDKVPILPVIDVHCGRCDTVSSFPVYKLINNQGCA